MLYKKDLNCQKDKQMTQVGWFHIHERTIVEVSLNILLIDKL